MRPLPINFVASRVGDKVDPENIDRDGLADWIGLSSTEADADSNVLDAILESSIDRCIKASGYIPSAEKWEFRYDTGPADLRHAHGLAPVSANRLEAVNLPRRPVRSLDSVTVDGDEVTETDTDFVSNPPRVLLPWHPLMDRTFASLVITAEMGPEPGEGADQRFVQAVYGLAFYMYENRGCDTSGAIKKSGASTLLSQIRVSIGGL